MSDLETTHNKRQLAEIASVFKALADPTRLAILQRLKTGPHSVTGLANEIGTSQANISKHLHLLHDVGLVTREPKKNQVFYSLETEAVLPLCDLVCGHINGRYRSRAEIEFSI